MPAINCPYCDRLVKDVSLLEAHYSHTSCREDDEKFREGIALENLSDGEVKLQQPLSARETATIAAGVAAGSRRDRDRQENVATHSVPQCISPPKKGHLEFINEALTNDDIAAHLMHQHTLPSEQELLEFIDEALMNNDLPAHLDFDEEMGNIEVEVGHEPAEPSPQATQRRSHGYATIEVHPNAARVYRWYFEDEQPGEPVKRDELHDKKIFEIAEWLMQAQVSNTKRAEFLNFELNREHYAYRKPSEMFKRIDAMEHGPEWQEFTLTISTTEGSETFVIYWRNPIDIIAYLIRQKRFRDHMSFGPEQHWTITLDGRKIRVYSEMWTGDWWWRLQNLLGEGATLAPFILATDATQMTRLSGSKVAWPVYASIGNISAHIRRRPSEHAMVLIGYLPVAKLNWITNPNERRKERWKLYHSALAMMLQPLRAAARDGVDMTCADGGVRRVHPVLSTHLGDWPEMCLFGTCFKTRCPVCVAEDDEMEIFEPAARLRTKPEVLSAFQYAQQGYTGMQVGLGLRPTWPYWALHPWASGPGMIVPDLLHQLWKGVFLDQIRPWWTKIIGSPEMDQRFASVPRYPSLRHFRSGPAVISQWTGNEARAMAKSFLGVVAGDAPEMGVEAARAVLDFMFRARQPQLDEDDLARLDHDVREFHATREIFLTRGVYTGEDFNSFAKMHMMGHYTHQIREWGAPDGYNTEGPERLHIEYVKLPYSVTGGVEPEGKMTQYLQRIEALCIRRTELERAGIIEPRKRRYRPDGDLSDFGDSEDDLDSLQDDSEGEEVSEDELDAAPGRREVANKRLGGRGAREQSAYQPEPVVSIAKQPTLPIVPATTIIEGYRAPGFLEAVRLYLKTQNSDLAYIIADEPTFGVYHKVTLIHPPLPFAPLGGPRKELVRASPARYNAHGLVRRPAFFDTVLIESNRCASGLQRYCPARVLVIFELPRHLRKQYSQVMAYVELFDEFSSNIPEQHGLPITEPLRHDDQPVRIVVPVTDLRLACHLVPDYASLRQQFPDSRWDSSSDMLSIAHRFFLNRHVNYYFFALMDHWRRINNHQRLQAGVA
ncbi:hypothetical protein FRC11_009933 [Ceratobasidium sp. 423]|nr:hypothetical protein FRC11_009933 [Ceratobasidium sp. 423]